jgi:class 3 adenylate cyclase/tetratricopeptide (TPR) repeat protein
MTILSAFIPIDRRLALAEGRDLPNRTSGAALFADISGFTALTARLSEKLGPHRAAEEITHQLNQVYSGLIQKLHNYGGAVISFSGDGILCWFDRALLGQPAARAAACALAMQRFMQALPPAPESGGQRLYLKVGLSAGAARRFVVGDPQIQLIETLAGSAVDQLAQAQRLIQRDEIMAGAPFLRQLDGVELGETRKTAAGQPHTVLRDLLTAVPHSPWPKLPDLPDERTRPWLLRPIVDRLRHGQGEFLSELRPAAPIFVRFTGIDYDEDEAAGEKLDGYIRWAQRTLAHYDGHLLQINMGDKGSYFYAVLGAPAAHEDDPARAVAAALALRETPTKFAFLKQVQIGLNLGQIHAGAYGGATRHTYGVIGQAVNVAARLMEYAEPGQLLITSALFDEAIERAALTALGPVQLHGQPEPYPLFSLDAARSAPTAERLKERLLAPLVGRQPERRQIEERLAQLRQGRGGNLLIEGEAGIGKSRLAAELIRMAEAEEILILQGSGEAIEQNSAYHAWRPIFQTLFDLTGVEETAVMRSQVLAALQDQPRLLPRAPLLNVVLPLNLPDNELTGQMQGELRAASVRDLLHSVLVKWCHERIDNGRALLLLMEDAHWLDSASWALLEQIRRTLTQLLIAVVTRPVDETTTGMETYRQLAAAANSVHLHLAPLSGEEGLQLAAQRLGVRQLPPEAADFIRQRAEGHPFFCEEIAYALRDTGLIAIEDENCRLLVAPQELQTLNFPNTIQGVITSRIDQLPPAQQLTLKVASVIGRVFTYRALYDVHPLAEDRDHLPAYLTDLARLDITPLDRPEPELAYIFKHIITQEVAYGLLLFAQRQQLHRAVAEWWEARFADNLAPYYSVLAHHWSKAEAWPQTVAYLEKAGERALRSSSYKEAIDFFKRALELAPAARPSPRPSPRPLPGKEPDDHQARWRWKLGEAYYGWGQYADSRTQLDAAAAAYGSPLPGGGWRLAVGMVGQVARQLAHRALPQLFLGRAQEAERERLLETAQIYNWVSRLAYLANEQGLGLYIALRMVNMTERAGPSPELVEAYGVMTVLTSLFRQPKLAEMYYQRALATDKLVGNRASRARMLLSCGLYHIETGQWATAQANISETVALFDQLGDKRQWGDATAMLASIYRYQGDFAQASKLASEVSGPRSGLLYHQMLGQIWRGHYLALQGELATAAALFQETLDLLAENPDEQMEMSGWAFLAWAQWRLGNEAAAEAAADKASAIMFASSAGATFGFPAYVAAAEVYLGLWEQRPSAADNQLSAADSWREKAGKICAALRFVPPIGQLNGWRCQAQYDWLDGKRKKALKGWERSLATAQRMGLPYEAARAEYELGRHLAEMGGDGRDHLQSARACLQSARDQFAQLGAAYDREQAERLLTVGE